MGRKEFLSPFVVILDSVDTPKTHYACLGQFTFNVTLADYTDYILQLLEHMILSRLLHVRIQVSQ